MKPGPRQISFLRAVNRTGSYYPGCGWTYGTRSESLRIAIALARRGLLVGPISVDRYENERRRWTMTDAGRAELRASEK